MSGIDFTSLRTPSNGSNTASNEPKEKAQFWANIGYSTTTMVGDGKEATEETRFIALPGGIPLDSVKPVATNSSNADYAAMQSARNHLLEQVMAVVNSLEPGEDKILNLQVQVRRVNGEREAIDPTTNQFVQQAPALV